MSIIPSGASRSLNRLAQITKKNSPTITFTLGLAGVISGAVLACRATLKLEVTLDEIQEDMDAVNTLVERGILDDKENARNVGIAYGRSAIKMGKLYGPSVVLGAGGVLLLATSHRQLKTRNKELGVALVAMAKMYDEYRARVAGEIGTEREQQIHNGYVNTSGKAKATPELVDPNAVNPYRFVFDEGAAEFEKNCAMNMAAFEAGEQYWTRRLRNKGFVRLSEVLDSLGIEQTGLSGSVGWVWNGDGDNYVDFGFRGEESFMDGSEPRVWLNFNCDGLITDKF